MQHNLPPLVSLAVIRGLTNEQSDHYYRGYYPQRQKHNDKVHKEQIAHAIGAVTIYQ